MAPNTHNITFTMSSLHNVNNDLEIQQCEYESVDIVPPSSVPAAAARGRKFRGSRNRTRSTSPVPQGQPQERRGGLLFRDSSKLQLPRIKYAEASKSILKVASLEDSLRSCQGTEKKDELNARIARLLLRDVQKSWRKLKIVKDDELEKEVNVNHPRGSDATGPEMMNLMLVKTQHSSRALDSLDLSSHSNHTKKAPVTERDLSKSWNHLNYHHHPHHNMPQPPMKKTVTFDTIAMRVYPVEPSDNPCVSGSRGCPGIALRGWNFSSPPPVLLEEYEATRPPRRHRQEDLKLDMMERRTRLLAHGATQAELKDFSRMIQNAKLQRAATVDELKIHGAGYQQKLETRERVGRFIQRAFNLRKTQSKEQSALWDQAQQQVQVQR